MATTKTVTNAITRAQSEFKGITLASADSLDFANQIYQIIGTATLWDFRIATGTTFGTTRGTQDYATVPTDFAALKAAWRQDDSSATQSLIPLEIKESLPKATWPIEPPRAISQENANLRLYPVPDQTRTGSGQWAIKFEYWTRVAQLTAVGNTFAFDDAFFPVFQSGFNARVAQFLDDARAGSWGGRDPSRNIFIGTGLWGDFAAQLNNMVFNESIASGSIISAPAEAMQRG